MRELEVIEDLGSSVIQAELSGGALDEPNLDMASAHSGFDAVGALDNGAPDDIWAESASEMSSWHPDLDPTIDHGTAGWVGGQPDPFA